MDESRLCKFKDGEYTIHRKEMLDFKFKDDFVMGVIFYIFRRGL
jgi:hypothetical protein